MSSQKARAKVPLGEELRPAEKLRQLFHTYFLLAVTFLVLPWYLPVLVFAPAFAVMIVTFVLLVVGAFILYWIGLFSETFVYTLSHDEIVWHRGVWFRETGIVPYNRITNVDIAQGPVSRRIGIASLKIQTAGYSGASRSATRAAEITIEGMANYTELRDAIMGFVHGKAPGAVGTYTGLKTHDDERVVSELVKIRKLLEKGR